MMSASTNADQIEAWNNRTGLRWAALQERIDALFAPLTEDLLAFAAAQEGMRVLDVGCGCGATVLAMAKRVGPTGHVLGVDVSAPMLGVAQRRLDAEDAHNARLLHADASVEPIAPGSINLLVSRFGVMFFDAPAAAFRLLRSALVPGGRLAFVCWQPLQDNAWFREPVEAIRPLLDPAPPPDPDAPGPFAFARPERVRAILADAGWSDVVITPHDTALRLGGPGDVEAATDFITQVGAAARLLAETTPEVQATAREAIVGRLAACEGPDGIVLGGATWMVAARA